MGRNDMGRIDLGPERPETSPSTHLSIYQFWLYCCLVIRKRFLVSLQFYFKWNRLYLGKIFRRKERVKYCKIVPYKGYFFITEGEALLEGDYCIDGRKSLVKSYSDSKVG